MCVSGSGTKIKSLDLAITVLPTQPFCILADVTVEFLSVIVGDSHSSSVLSSSSRVPFLFFTLSMFCLPYCNTAHKRCHSLKELVLIARLMRLYSRLWPLNGKLYKFSLVMFSLRKKIDVNSSSVFLNLWVFILEFHARCVGKFRYRYYWNKCGRKERKPLERFRQNNVKCSNTKKEKEINRLQIFQTWIFV